MQGARVLVVAEDRAIGETVRVALAARTHVDVTDPRQLGSAAGPPPPLVVTDCAATRIRTLLPPGWRAAEPTILRVPSIADGGSAAPGLAIDALLRRCQRILAALAEPSAAPSGLLPAAVRAALVRVADSQLPCLLHGERGCGKRRAALALAQRIGLPLVAVSGDRLAEQPPSPNDAVGAEALLFVADFDRCRPADVEALARLFPASYGGEQAGPRLVIGSALAPSALVERFAGQRADIERWATVSLALPPLRQRGDELDELLATVAAAAGRAGDQLRLSAAALDRLRTYLWPGNLGEFESVVLRTLTLAPSATIAADEVRFTAEAPLPSATTAPAGEAAASGGDPGLALLITEIAHEFKNPMVVVKTGAQQIERSLAAGSAPAELARLTSEAVDRMDRVLENLMQYSRFQRAERRPVAVRELLSSSLANLEAELADKRIAVDWQALPDRLVAVDPLQIAYASENLLRVLVRDAPPGSALSLRGLAGRDGYAIEVARAPRAVSHKLAAALDDAGAEAPPPLGVRVAQDLVARSGGRLRRIDDHQRTVVEVELPSGGGVGKDDDEEAPHFDS